MFNEKVKFAHIHIPKTAGTSLLSMLGVPNNRLHVGSTYTKSNKYPGRYVSIPTHCGIYQAIQQKILPPHCVTFTVIRNTWDRMLSMYLDYSTRTAHNQHVGNVSSFEGWLKDLHNVVFSGSQLCYMVNHPFGQGYVLDTDKDFSTVLDTISITYWLRFHRLAYDWRCLCEAIHIPYEPL